MTLSEADVGILCSLKISQTVPPTANWSLKTHFKALFQLLVLPPVIVLQTQVHDYLRVKFYVEKSIFIHVLSSKYLYMFCQVNNYTCFILPYLDIKVDEVYQLRGIY